MLPATNLFFTVGTLVAERLLYMPSVGLVLLAGHAATSLSRRYPALLVYGVGDGGGGPTRPMLERLRRVQDLDGIAQVRHATPLQFFQDVEADAVAAASRLTKGWAEGEIPSTANTIMAALDEEVSKQEAEAEVVVSETAADAVLSPATLSPTAPVGGGLQRWVGELYFEYHRGTYTTQAKIKRGNRLCQVALHNVSCTIIASIWVAF